jgi:hypothetical protein
MVVQRKKNQQSGQIAKKLIRMHIDINRIFQVHIHGDAFFPHPPICRDLVRGNYFGSRKPRAKLFLIPMRSDCRK